MKKTHKLRVLRAEAEALITSGASVSETARRLGVARSSVQRWLSGQKLSRPALSNSAHAQTLPPHTTASTEPSPEQSPAEWAASQRANYQLSDVESVLLTLAENALTIARDQQTRPEVRLAAMTRFQSFARQLNFEQEDSTHGKAPSSNVRPWPRSAG